MFKHTAVVTHACIVRHAHAHYYTCMHTRADGLVPVRTYTYRIKWHARDDYRDADATCVHVVYNTYLRSFEFEPRTKLTCCEDLPPDTEYSRTTLLPNEKKII